MLATPDQLAPQSITGTGGSYATDAAQLGALPVLATTADAWGAPIAVTQSMPIQPGPSGGCGSCAQNPANQAAASFPSGSIGSTPSLTPGDLFSTGNGASALNAGMTAGAAASGPVTAPPTTNLPWWIWALIGITLYEWVKGAGRPGRR